MNYRLNLPIKTILDNIPKRSWALLRKADQVSDVLARGTGTCVLLQLNTPIFEHSFCGNAKTATSFSSLRRAS